MRNAQTRACSDMERHEGKSKLVREMRNAHTRDVSIVGSYDIRFLCSDMRIQANGEIYDMEFKKLDFENWGVRHEGKRKLVPQMRNAHTRACEYIKQFIDGSYDIGFLCSNMQ